MAARCSAGSGTLRPNAAVMALLVAQKPGGSAFSVAGVVPVVEAPAVVDSSGDAQGHGVVAVEVVLRREKGGQQADPGVVPHSVEGVGQRRYREPAGVRYEHQSPGFGG